MRDVGNAAGTLRTVDRALVVLNCFTDEHPERGVLELARELGLDKSQVHRVLATLAERGFVTVNPMSRRYRLGPALLGLGRRAEHSIGLDGAIRGALHELAQEFRQSAVFNVPDGADYRCAAAVDFPGPLRYAAAIGEPFPGHGGASGHAIFAYFAAEQVRALFPIELPRLTPHSPTSVEALLHRYAEVRKCGFAISEGEYDSRVMAVAAPVFVAGSVVGSVSIAGSAEAVRDRAHHISTAVRATADRLSQRYPAEPGPR